MSEPYCGIMPTDNIYRRWPSTTTLFDDNMVTWLRDVAMKAITKQ